MKNEIKPHSWMDREPWTADEMEKHLKVLNEQLEKQREKFNLKYNGNWIAGIDDGSYPI